MQNNLGYTKNLFILPFDHRSSFLKLDPNPEKIKEYKEIIYEAFKHSLSLGIHKENSAILVDEQFGDKILVNARNQGYITILTTEKSGGTEFDFEYGEQFGEHIEKYKPTFVKALVRHQLNLNWTRLKILSDYCHEHGYKFLLEVLTENKTASQALDAIKEFQNLSIEPDIWKLEGMDNETDYQNIVHEAKIDGRLNVGVVVLGRGADQETVEKWITLGAKVKGVIGFAVGRTVFWEALVEYKNGNINKEKAIEIISTNFLHFYNIFIHKE